MSLYRILVFILFLSLLTGCSTLQKDAAYYAQHLYRRIPYETDGKYRVINIFYATDRVVKGKRDDSLKFLSKLADKMTYGDLDIKINPALKIDKMFPKRLKRKGLIGVQKIGRLDEETFMKRLDEAVKNSPHNSLLVMVMGYKDNFELTATKAASFAYLLDADTPILLFDWPGDQSVTPWGYKKACTLAAKSGPHMGHVLTRIIHEIEPKKLWIESSSLGCQVACSAFEYMYKNENLSDPETEIAHVVMAAPDVSEDEFNEHFKNEIVSLAESLTVYVSSDDNALLLSEIIDFDKKLGRQKLKVKKHSQFEEAKDMLYLKSFHPEKIAIVDVTPINHASFKHGYYLESPDYFDDVYLRISGGAAHTNRRRYLVDIEDKKDYWVLRGRK